MPLFRSRTPKPVPLEEQLSTLARCGIRMKESLTVEDLLKVESREMYERYPFDTLLMVLGSEEFRGHGSRAGSDDVRHLDTECIEDHGDYSGLIRDIEPMWKGDLPLEGVRDFFDPDEGEAWVELQLAGQSHRLDLAVDDDWLDDRLFAWLSSLLAQHGSDRRMTYLAPNGQSFSLGCLTDRECEELARATPLKPEQLC